MTKTQTTRHPFTVRKINNWGFPGFVVVSGKGRRVSTDVFPSEAAAQANADVLNVNELTPAADIDPRPYAVRRAETIAAYEAQTGRTVNY